MGGYVLCAHVDSAQTSPSSWPLFTYLMPASGSRARRVGHGTAGGHGFQVPLA